MRDIGDARLELEDPRELDETAPAPGSVSRLRLVVMGILLAAATAAATLAVWSKLRPEPPGPALMRFEIASTETLRINGDPAHQALSPDGSMLVFREGGGEGRLWVRSMETMETKVLEGTANTQSPFWSPDGASIGFFADGKLKRIPAGGGAVVELCEVGHTRGGTWSEDGTILFADAEGPIFQIKATGGAVEPATILDEGETAHRFPNALPDGRFLYVSLPPQNGKFRVFRGALGSSKRDLVVHATGSAVYVNGHVIYQRDGSLAIQRLDGETLPLTKEPLLIRESMNISNYAGAPGFSAAGNGSVVYSTFRLENTRLVWADKEGRELEQVPIDPAPYTSFKLSNDGRKVALVRQTAPLRSEIWIGDMERGVVSRFSTEPKLCDQPTWSPDGSRVVYSTEDLGPQVIVVRDLRQPDNSKTYLESNLSYKRIHDWSADGEMLLISLQDSKTLWDVWLLPLGGDQEPQEFVRTPYIDLGVSLSPDQRWAAFTSEDSGRPRLYVQSYPKPGLRYQVTKGRGQGGRWIHGGRRFVYFDPEGVKVADVIPGKEFRLGPGQKFGTPHPDAVDAQIGPDAERVLYLLPAEAPEGNSLTVVLNAFAQ